jgi:hypothetical protein
MKAPGAVVAAITGLPMGRMVKETGDPNCCVSSWSRISDQASPLRVKCAAIFFNGRLAYMQANADGCDSTIMLNAGSNVAEAPGGCIYIIRARVPVTPSVTEGILESIARATVAQLFAGHFDLVTEERDQPHRVICSVGDVPLRHGLSSSSDHRGRPAQCGRRQDWAVDHGHEREIHGYRLRRHS